MWAVRPGDPFPGEYPNIFAKRIKQEDLFNNLAEAKARPDINKTTHIVNVTVDFKYGPETRRKTKSGPAAFPAVNLLLTRN